MLPVDEDTDNSSTVRKLWKKIILSRLGESGRGCADLLWGNETESKSSREEEDRTVSR